MRTDQELLTMLQYAAFEAPDNGVSWPSGLWARQEVLDYLNERQNRALKAALFQLGVADTDPADPILARTSVIALPADWIATVSVVWTSADGTQQRELIRADTFEIDHGDPTWTTTAKLPLVYMDYAQPTLQLQLGPIPATNGRVSILYVPNAETLTGDGDVIYQVPDEFADAFGKYGPLADMFGKQGRGRSPEKATYAELRYQLGLDAAAIILGGRF